MEEIEKQFNPFDFRSYGKVYRLGKEEVDGILEGECSLSEKVDGSNTSIWLDENEELKAGSRNRQLGNEEFNGFIPYIKNHDGVRKLLGEYPLWRLYGEWLVRHTISYKETSYKKWYLFDIFDNNTKEYLPQKMVQEIARQYNILSVPDHGTFTNPTIEQINEFVGKSEFGERGEGVVIKNLEFKNKFGDTCYAKIVTESFKEDNGIAFGGNNKYSDTYNEMYVVNKYMTLSRVQKILNKIQPEINEKLDMKHIPRITNTCYHDLLTEEIWDIQADIKSINFTSLKRIALKKAKQIFVDILEEEH